MTIPRSAAQVLSEHVGFELECIDRMYLTLYQPKLAYASGVVGFFKGHRGMPFVSGALMDPMSKAFVADVHRFVKEKDIDLVHFDKGVRKDDVAQRYLAGHDGSEGVLFVGRAQEKARVWRTERRVNPSTGKAYPWLVRATAMPDSFYFYCFDKDFGPFFLEFCTYFPYTGKACSNGHHWSQQQARAAGIGFEALDNGFLSADDPRRLQEICDRLGPGHIERFVRKWLALLPHPFSAADRRAGYLYQISVLQAEMSLTQVLDRPLSGRVFFEDVVRSNLDAGRPDKVSLIFDRRVTKATQGRWRTRVVTQGVAPSLHVDYKHSNVKQYFKLGRAVRTECTVNDTTDFGIGRLLHNLPALRKVGFSANRRLLEVERTSSDPMAGEGAYDQVCRPVHIGNQRVPGLRFDAPSTQGLLAALVTLRLLHNGFSNADMRGILAPYLGLPPSEMTQGRMSYHLRRLRLHGMIERVPHTNRYLVTDFGLSAAMFLSRAHSRFVLGGLADAVGATGPSPPLRRALQAVSAELDRLAARSGLAA